jgi:DNA topoisomerase-1
MTDNSEIIKESGLVYITDQASGIYRKGKSGHFFYVNKDGHRIQDEEQLKRIISLVLPPAWTSVWISPKANSHLQATGIDTAGRKQYKYHEKWIKRRSDHKYFRLLEFGKALPKARKQLQKDLLRPDLDERKVLAICVDLMQKTLLRVGGKTYMQQYRSIGLSTLQDKHVRVEGNSLHLHFIGKKAVRQDVQLTDRRLVRLIQKCKEIPGQELFQYYDGSGQRNKVDSGQINQYIKEITASDFTAKDFRTWGATLEAFRQFVSCFLHQDERSDTKIEIYVLDCVAEKLGNTRAICKSSYVYPILLEAHRSTTLTKWLKKKASSPLLAKMSLEDSEKLLLAFLKYAERTH